MTTQAIHNSYDVVIVGARVAGAATAMLLASRGLRVLVFDKSRFGSDTLSTHALMRPAVLLLNRWGITERLEREDTPRIEKTTFVYTDERAPTRWRSTSSLGMASTPCSRLGDRCSTARWSKRLTKLARMCTTGSE